MSPAEFAEARERLGLTALAASRVLGVTERSVWRYMAGTQVIPEPVARLLRVMIALRLTAKQVLALLRRERDRRTARASEKNASA